MALASQSEEIRVGPAGWSYDDWAGIVYPVSRPRGFHEAAYLAEYFDTIELNVTFYRPITAEMAKKWSELVARNPHFLFTAKLWQKFTHECDLSRENQKEFRPGMEALRQEGKLGALLAQFPWSFKNMAENRDYLEKLVEQFSDFPLVVEVRHASWNEPAFYDWLTERKIGFCNIDQPVIGRSLKPTQQATAPVGYVRLHGRNYKEWFREREDEGGGERYDYLYSLRELDPWVDRIRAVAESARHTFVITNNHFHGKAVTNALQLVHLLTRKPVKAPPPLLRHYPELEPIASREGITPSLFG
jgi:uncharacterized protein YecE (DUF72 family)